MGKNDERTRDRLKKLAQSIGKIETKNEKTENNNVKKNNGSVFKTSEIIALILLTCLVSLLMGGLIVYKLNINGGKYLDKELQEIIKSYEYINSNYYGNLNKEEMSKAAIQGMLGTLDEHSTYIGDSNSETNRELEGNYKGIGIQVYTDDNKNVVIYSVFKNSPASKAGIKKDDILIKVAGQSLEGMDSSKISEIIKKQKSKFDIVLKRGEEEVTVTVSLSSVDLTSVVSKIFERDDKKVGYIYASIFANNTYKQFKKELTKLEKKGIDSLIIDLRDNSGGHLTSAEDILSLFLDSTHPIYQLKGEKENKKYYSKGDKDKKYKIVMLVNNGSASASELTTSALKEQYGAVVVGAKTYGKSTIQEVQDLSSGGKYKLTTRMWLTSKGKKINGKGINPDIEVNLDDKYKEEAKIENDNQFQKALEEALK